MVRYFFNVVVPVMRLFPGCWDSSSSFHVTFGESYEEAARGELKEETGVSAALTYLGKFMYHVPPENEIVTVFSCRSDDAIRIDPAESSEASFHTRDDVNAIRSEEHTSELQSLTNLVCRLL